MTGANALAQKEARKKARQAAKRLPPPVVPPDAIRKLELLDGVPEKAMNALVAKAKGVVFERDSMLATPNEAPKDPYLNLVVAGQVGCGEWTEEAQKAVGAKAKEEIFKKVGQTLAVFAYGDFYSDEFAKQAGGGSAFTPSPRRRWCASRRATSRRS